MAKPLEYGELQYKGRRINPDTYDSRREARDLRSLVGRCQSCGAILTGIEAIPQLDPYADDIQGVEIMIVACTDCLNEMAADI